jgi:serine/threonine-protein kinase
VPAQPAKPEAPAPAAATEAVAAEPAPTAEPADAAPVAAAEPATPVTRSKREPKRSREQLRMGTAASASAPAATEESLEGEGELRIGTAPALAGKKTTVVLPDGGREELPYAVRSTKAGRYSLEFSSPEGPARCEVKVHPGKRTLVVFDGKGCKVQYLD